MVKVFVHGHAKSSRPYLEGMWQNEAREFTRVPAVGEHIAMDSASKDWYEVRAVVHCPFRAEFDAEVYCEMVDHLAVIKAAKLDRESLAASV